MDIREAAKICYGWDDKQVNAALYGWEAERVHAPLPIILPCPFCGGSAYSVADSKADWKITCSGERDEECRGIMQEPMGYLCERFAIEAWNKRP